MKEYPLKKSDVIIYKGKRCMVTSVEDKGFYLARYPTRVSWDDQYEKLNFKED